MIIYIDNLHYPFHTETLESVILKYDFLLRIKRTPTDIVYLNLVSTGNEQFIKYLTSKFPNMQLKTPATWDFKIITTFYPRDLKNPVFQNDLKNRKVSFICHEISNETIKHPNIFYLTPLCRDSKKFLNASVLPPIQRKKTDFPIYVVQGNITWIRRNYNLLLYIFSQKFQEKFKIKLIGRGSVPSQLAPFKDYIIPCLNLDFEKYHEAFSDAYGIFPLISKKTQPQYYCNKLTSTINYAQAYDLKCIIDKDLQDIYKLKNACVYKDDKDIVNAFKASLMEFYKK